MTRALTLLWNIAVILSITAGMAMAQLNTGTTTVYFWLYDPNSGASHIRVSGWGIPGTESAYGYPSVSADTQWCQRASLPG